MAGYGSVQKEKVRCRVLLGTWLVEADFHYIPGSRLTDALNFKGADFVPLTDAVVMDAASGEKLFETSYMSVGRLSILGIWTLGEAPNGENASGEE